MSSIILNRADLLCFVTRARCPLDSSISSLFLSYQNDLIAALDNLSSASVQLIAQVEPPPSHTSASSFTNVESFSANASRCDDSSASRTTSTSSLSSPPLNTSSTMDNFATWTGPQALFHTNPNAIAVGHGPAPAPAQDFPAPLLIIDDDVGADEGLQPWTDVDMNFGISQPALPLLSDVIAPRIDGNDDPFNWSIVLNIIACRPEGFPVGSLWRAFKIVYLQLPANLQKTPWQVLMKRYRPRFRGSALASELSTVVHFENCMVTSSTGSLQAGIYVPFLKTPYYLFRQQARRWLDHSQTFQ